MKRYRKKYQLDDSLIGWIVKTAKKNHWRVASWYELEDLIQDGMICYLRIRDRYQVANQPHFMALVKTTFTNHITILAVSKSRSVDVPISDVVLDGVDQMDSLDELAGPQPEESTFIVMLSKLPYELKELLDILMRDAKDIPMLTKGRIRETNNEYLCRLINIDPTTHNLEEMFRKHFAGEPIYVNQSLSFWL